MANDYKTTWDAAARGNWRNAILTGSNKETFDKAGKKDAELISHTFEAKVGRPPESVMDFGCGAGRILVPMLDKVDKGYGVDISPGMLDLCSGRAGVARNKLQTLVYGRDKIGQLGVDIAYSWLCLQHMEYAHAFEAMGVMFRALKPGGMFVATFPNAHSDAYWQCIQTFGQRGYPFPAAHVRVYVPDMVDLFLARAGFTSIEVQAEAPVGRSTVSRAEILGIGFKPE